MYSAPASRSALRILRLSSRGGQRGVRDGTVDRHRCGDGRPGHGLAPAGARCAGHSRGPYRCGGGVLLGNAGYLTPAKTTPLADPSLWTYGPRALVDPDAALHVPFRFDLGLWSFLARFAGHGTMRAWHRTMAALTPINQLALGAFDQLSDGGVHSPTRSGPFVVAFTAERQAEGFVAEMSRVAGHGQDIPLERLADPQELAPQLSGAVQVAYRLDGQRFIEPGPFVESLGEEVRARGGDLRTGVRAVDVDTQAGPAVLLDSGEDRKSVV